MSKLKKYSNFEDLKSDIKPDKPVSEKDNKVLVEFEAFLKLLQQQDNKARIIAMSSSG